jgi:hypothetical protein
MIVEKKEKKGPIEIDLTGPAGNAFNLLGVAKKLARKLDLDGDAITTEMMAGDYENLLEVFDKNFGEYVILYR